MEDKIYEKLKHDHKESSKRYLKFMGMDKDYPIKDVIPKKNFDFMTILNRTGLIEENPENSKKINDFHDYLFKYGINLGIGQGKKVIIEAIQNGKVNFEDLLDINPEDYVNHDLQPTYIRDMKEAILK